MVKQASVKWVKIKTPKYFRMVKQGAKIYKKPGPLHKFNTENKIRRRIKRNKFSLTYADQ